MFLSGPGQLLMYGIRTGRMLPILSPDDAARHPELVAARRMLTNRIVGGPNAVVAQMMELVRKTDADEIMVSTFAYGIEDRLRSLVQQKDNF